MARRNRTDRDAVRQAVRDTLLTIEPGRYKARAIARIARERTGQDVTSRDVARHIAAYSEELKRISVYSNNNHVTIYLVEDEA